MAGVLCITGITGKSGRFFADMLCQNHDEVRRLFPGGVRVLLRHTSDTTCIDSKAIDFEKCYGNLDDACFLEEALAGVDTLLHIAGIQMSLRIAQAAVHCGVRRLILVHTTGIYSKFKSAGEEYRKIDSQVYDTCDKAQIKLTILRPTMIYGDLNDRNIAVFIKLMDKLPVMPVVNGAHFNLQPVHCRDLGTAFYQVLMNEGATVGEDFDLSGGDAISLRDILSEIAACLGKPARFVSIPFPLAYAGAWGLFLVTFGSKDYREKVQRLCEPRAYSHDKAACFGYAPMRFSEGVAGEVWQYLEYKDSGNKNVENKQ